MSDSVWEAAIDLPTNQLIQKPDEFSSEQSHPCPVCGNQLTIHIGRYQRDAVRMIGVTFECQECNQAIAID